MSADAIAAKATVYCNRKAYLPLKRRVAAEYGNSGDVSSSIWDILPLPAAQPPNAFQLSATNGDSNPLLCRQQSVGDVRQFELGHSRSLSNFRRGQFAASFSQALI